MSQDDLLTVREVAEVLRVCSVTVMRHVHGPLTPRLAAVRLGRRFLIRRGTLEKFILAAERIESAA